jgi:hypothetical protein
MYENKEQRARASLSSYRTAVEVIPTGAGFTGLIAHHKTGDVVTLTLNSRDSWQVPGEEKERVKNNWSLTSASTGLAVAHDRPEQGQPLQAFPVDTFASHSKSDRPGLSTPQT